MTMKVVIIGGDAAGMSAASKLKREKPDIRIIVFERDQHISYAAWGMPYWFSGVVTSEEDLKALTLQEARDKRGIDVRIRHEVTAIDRANKTLRVCRLDTGDMLTETYDKLMIATGASAVRPPIAGLDLPGIFTLRSLTDGERLNNYLKDQQPRRGVIIGAGYVGLEVAEAFRKLGIETGVVEVLPQIMPNMDADMVSDVAEHLAEKGVTVYTGTKVTGIERAGGHLLVQTGGRSGALPADVVLVSTGVRPNSDLAQAAGLKLSARNAIRVNEYLCTSDPDIYAAGDCVAYRHLVLNEHVWIPLAPSANKEGRIVGENLAGQSSIFPGILGTAVVKVFDYTLALTGLTQRQAQQYPEKFQGGVVSTVVTARDKPHYYPGGKPVKIKVVLEKATGRILGAQLVARSDVSKRADIFAVAITAGMTVEQVGLLDLTYAPPYATAYDPVLVAANAAAREVVR